MLPTIRSVVWNHGSAVSGGGRKEFITAHRGIASQRSRTQQCGGAGRQRTFALTVCRHMDARATSSGASDRPSSGLIASESCAARAPVQPRRALPTERAGPGRRLPRDVRYDPCLPLCDVGLGTASHRAQRDRHRHGGKLCRGIGRGLAAVASAGLATPQVGYGVDKDPNRAVGRHGHREAI